MTERPIDTGGIPDPDTWQVQIRDRSKTEAEAHAWRFFKQGQSPRVRYESDTETWVTEVLVPRALPSDTAQAAASAAEVIEREVVHRQVLVRAERAEAEVEALREQVADMDRHISDLDRENLDLHEATAPRLALAEAEVERLGRLRDQSIYADGEHMADLAVTIKIQAGQIATLSNQLDYANEGKAALEAELVRLRADRDAYRARIDAVRALAHEMERDGDADEWIQAKRLLAALDGA